MLVELVRTTTADGCRLDGAWASPPPGAPAPPGAEAWLLLHGTGSNFYSSDLLAFLARRLAAAGAAVLRANTRGHDLVYAAAVQGRRRYLGAAFEAVDEARLDLAAWAGLAAERGARRLGVLGHSLGGVKAICALAQGALPEAARLVALSPPRLSHAALRAGTRGALFSDTFARAQQLVDQGQGETLLEVQVPLPFVVSARAYLDRYGPHEPYHVVRWLSQVPCPTLVTFGAEELLSDDAFRGLPDEIAAQGLDSARLQLAVVAGADHGYTACYDALAGRLLAWLRKGAA